VLEAPILRTGPETGGYRLLGVLGPRFLFGVRPGRPFVVRSVAAAGRVAVARGDAPGVQLSADPADRRMSERGKRPGGARRTLSGAAHAGGCARNPDRPGSSCPAPAPDWTAT
jgi:hypothetical protein